MSEELSLTDAVKQIAVRKTSLWEAVKHTAAGGHEDMEDSADDPRDAESTLDSGAEAGASPAHSPATPDVEPAASVQPAVAVAPVPSAPAAAARPSSVASLAPAAPPISRARGWGTSLVVGVAKLGAVVLLAVLINLPLTNGAGPDARGAAGPPKRVALVVGNSAYSHTPRLPNPKHDAADMAAVLRRLGWHVIEGFDLDKAAFDRKVREFSIALQGAEAGAFYYAGHGLQVAGHNYLVPVDARLTTASALDFEMVRLDLVQRAMEGAAQANFLVIDACRDNPLSRNLARAMGTRSADIGHGLARVEGGIGTLVSFSTQPGNVALDGKGRNSPFTGALVRHLGASHDDLSAVLIAVRNDVVKATGRRQVPWEHSALTARFYFNPAPLAAVVAVAPQLKLSEAAEAWSATRDITSVAVLDIFATRFADTFYAELARARIEDLRKAQEPQW